jgi:ATP-dependent Lhr-like helicase
VSVFARFSPRLQEAIVARVGWSSLRPVQDEAGEAILDGMNIVVIAPTAGGKTEAAIFPILSHLLQESTNGVAALYVAPIKALLNNQSERLGLYTEMVGLGAFVWHGDTPDNERRRFLQEPVELLMTTPESLEVMLVSRRVDAKQLFEGLRFVVFDEIHAVAGTDRGAHLMSVIERLADLSRHDVQRVGLSATVGNPDAILTWLQGTSERSRKVIVPPDKPASRQVLIVHRPDLAALASDAARVAKGIKSLFFCQTRSMTEVVAEHMRREGTTVFVHHSAVSREERQLAEERFNHGSDACIVCTSTLELGIDVGDLDRVLQAEAPDTVSSFLQRMGRTGRRPGQTSNTTFFCETTEGVLQAAALVEMAKAGWVEDVELNDRCWPVLVHQVLAMALSSNGVPVEEAWLHLTRVPDFRGIHRAEFDRLIAWMLRDRSLLMTSGRLVLGPKAERRFGRRHFMELYAVFSSPQTYTVQTASGQALGSLNQGFVDRLVDGVSCFLLGGRPWAVVRVQHDDRRVVVEVAPGGRKPTWGGFLPQFLSHVLCQRILALVKSTDMPVYMGAEAAAALGAYRDSMRGVLEPLRGGIEIVNGEIRWWTFAGGRVNATLRYALEAVDGSWKVIPDNFSISIRGEDVGLHRVQTASARLTDPEFWENEQLWQRVAASLPSYRLSKFQPLMPPWIEREIVANYLLDLAGAWRWLAGAEPARFPTFEPARNTISAPTGRELEELATVRRDADLPTMTRDESRPLHWVNSGEALLAMCDALRGERTLGLDVETTMQSRALCLMQIATPSCTYLVDPLEVTDLAPLADVLSDPDVIKIIHNADFERAVLSRYELKIEPVLDTLVESRRLRVGDEEWGHSLKSVCEREFGVTLDKSEQTSDWTKRPLTDSQRAYAALDSEVLLRLHERFATPRH